MTVPFQQQSSLHQSLKDKASVNVSFVNQTFYLNVGIVLLGNSREIRYNKTVDQKSALQAIVRESSSK